MNSKLNRVLLTDFLFLYPLVISAGFLYPDSGLLNIVVTTLNILLAVISFILVCTLDEFYKAISLDFKDRDSFIWTYTISSSIVELGVFIYLGWYGFTVLWILALCFMANYFMDSRA